MTWLRRMIYRLGLRPKSGSIFYSPSAVARLTFQAYGEGFTEGIKKGSALRITESGLDESGMWIRGRIEP